MAIAQQIIKTNSKSKNELLDKISRNRNCQTEKI